jgi:DNA-binding transcriptional LysR family regulator
MKGLEERLGLRLLTRTTRSAPTEAGEKLFPSIGPRFEEIEAEIAALSALRETPSGIIRISTAEHAADAILWPKLKTFLRKYPDIRVELIYDIGLTNIVAERMGAGVRLGEQVEKDMIAVRIAPDMRIAVVGSAGYFANRRLPQKPQDLVQHRCINLRLPTYGGLYAWEFEKVGRELKVHVEGQLAFNSLGPLLAAALDGFWRIYLKIWSRHTSQKSVSREFWKIGAHPFRAITFTIPAAANPRRHLCY